MSLTDHMLDTLYAGDLEEAKRGREAFRQGYEDTLQKSKGKGVRAWWNRKVLPAAKSDYEAHQRLVTRLEKKSAIEPLVFKSFAKEVSKRVAEEEDKLRDGPHNTGTRIWSAPDEPRRASQRSSYSRAAVGLHSRRK